MKLTLIDFWAEWCNPCKRMSPVIEKLAQEFSDQVELVKVDADKPENEYLLEQYDIRSIPTLVLAHNNTVYGQLTGQQSEAKLRDWLHYGLDEFEHHLILQNG